MRIWRKKSCDIFRLMVSSIQWSFSATKRWISLTCVEKLHANETRKQCYDLRQKQVIGATGLSKQYTDTYRDSHDVARHNLRRTLAKSFQQFHLPFHLQFVTLDLFSQDSQCDPTEERHSNICLELQMYHLCACLVNLSSSWSPITKCEQPIWQTDGSVDAGGDEVHRPTNTWWWRNMVCLSAGQSAEKPSGEQWSQRETIEARGTKWNFDVETDSGMPGPTMDPRWDEGMPTATVPMEILKVPPPAPPPEEHIHEIRVHSNCGGGDVAGTTGMVNCHPSQMNLAKTKVIGKVVRYTNILEALLPELLNEDDKLIDTGQIIIAQKLQACKNDIN